MNPREQRGLAIAALCKLNRKNGVWIVPSQTAPQKNYAVDMEKKTCNCPDCQEAGMKCKHQFAVEFVIKRELGTDGSVSETRSVTVTETKTYAQDWPAYNRAQTTEKHRFQVLLHDLCRGVPKPERQAHRAGRSRVLLSDALFAATFKVYSTVSTRRFACDLADAHERGYITKPIHYNSVCKYLESRELTPVLHSLIVRSALPLNAVETKFAFDSSGFSCNRFQRWYDHRYGVTRQKSVWVKAHIACGVKTNVIAAVRILDKDAGDSPQFRPLLKATSEGFKVEEAYADKAYSSVDNLEAVAKLGGSPYIAFKSSATGWVGGVFEKTLNYFKFKQDEFLAHYHQRSNVESTFSSVKRKFGDSIRSRDDVACVNEVLCKFLCHNLCVLIQEQHELGIEPVLWPTNQVSDVGLSAEKSAAKPAAKRKECWGGP